MNIIVNLLGLILIVLVIWWFWWKNKLSKATIAHSKITIKVANGVYTPSMIKMKRGETLTIYFIREEENPCAAKVIFADFNQSAELPVGKLVPLTITPEKEGKYEFTCQMGMYRGILIVSE